MGFFDALRRVLGGHGSAGLGAADQRLSKVWGLEEPAVEAPATDEASAFDRAQWQKRLKRILADLPASAVQWQDFMTEAKALHFDPKWIREREYEEFRLMVRRAVSERKFTEADHRKIDMARDLMRIPEAEAELILHEIVSEAEKFFGKSVEGA